MEWELIAFFGSFIGFVILLLVLTFVIKPLSPKKEETVTPASPVPPKQTPRPSSFATTTASSPKPTFSSVKTITSEGANTFNFIISSGNSGYLSYRNERDLKKWGVDLPLSYTHVRMDGKIIELTNPSSSDSRGKILDSVPANILTNTIEFGTFF